MNEEAEIKNPFDIYDVKYSPKEIPSQLTLPVCVYYRISGYDAGKIGIYGFDWKGDKDGIVLGTAEVHITLNVNSSNIAQIAINSLRESVKEIQAKAWKDVQALEAQIEKLQLITYQGEEQVLPPNDDIDF